MLQLKRKPNLTLRINIATEVLASINIKTSKCPNFHFIKIQEIHNSLIKHRICRMIRFTIKLSSKYLFTFN